jgi:formylglycine-generating enzyme required for sulfatase activity
LIIGLTGSALYAMEKARSEDLKKSAKASSARGAGHSASPAGTQDFEAAFSKLAERVAKQRSLVPPESTGDEDMARVLEYAQARSDLAEAGAKAKSPRALALAREAAQCYMALHEWQSGMVFIPPGDVSIGDDNSSNVLAADGFFIDTCEVTNGQYLEFCNKVEGGWRWPPYDLAAAPSNMPVVNVTFYDAQAYAAWAGKHLPTEVQWARAAYGDKTASARYPWGEEWQPEACNCGTEQGANQYVAACGSFSKDRTWSGCFDMAGNVSEWTQTAFKELPYDPLDGRNDPARLTFGSLVSVRGGNYRDAARTFLSARLSWPFEAHDAVLGFRCVKELPKEGEDVDGAVAQ